MIDDRLDQYRSRTSDHTIELAAAGCRIVDLDSLDSGATRNRDKVGRIQIAGILRVSEENHLLPLNLSQRVVLDHDDLDVELVCGDSNQVRRAAYSGRRRQ